MLALGTLSSSLKLYNVAGLFEEEPYRPMQLDPSYEILDIHQKSVFFLDWSNKEDTIVTCSNDQTVFLL
jgi:WD40 repeat protein